ncbi:hypothetical protein Mapa_008025 [Marchantia paleacea]|nr:hypothetical protein Mapa_008025 [Marchantia paleacea]
MRREGRIHGSYVRMSKHEDFEYNKGAPRRPTNHSRVTSCCLNNKVRCCCCHTMPVLKAMSKTKGMFKLKDLDITSNHKLVDFRLSYSSRYLSRDSAADLRYYDDYCLSDTGSDCDDDEDGEMDLDENQCSPDMMVTIASFLRDMRSAPELIRDADTPGSISEEEAAPDETASEHGSCDHEAENKIGAGTDSDCSWAGVDVSDSEHSGVDVDGWYLVG